MIPLSVFLLACAAVYLGSIEAGFSALMRLSLRLVAERSRRPGALGTYLDDPLLLFIPIRLLLGLVTGAATALLARGIGVDEAHRLSMVALSLAAFVLLCELLLPLVIVGRDPERVLEVLLPPFAPIGRALGPTTRWIARIVPSIRRGGPPPTADEATEEANETAKAHSGAAEQEGLIETEERRLLQSIVDFGGTLVREVMTPRPDIVAIRDTATVGDVRALFREQEYSRFPVYKDSLDNIAGFIFVKDLVTLSTTQDARPIAGLLRPAVVVPETKRVTELLKQFQRQQTQCAIVDEGNGRYVFSGKVNIGEVAQRLDIEIEREGFETVGGYLLSHIGRVPAVGERFELDGLSVEVTEAPGQGDRFVLDLVKNVTSPVFLILNKIDLIRKSKLLPIMQQYSERGRFAEIVPVSAGTGDNVDRLERALIDRLPEGEPRYPADYLTDQPERFFASEIVREKLLQFTHAEIPFSSAVVVERFEEPEAETGMLRLFCTIVVERESQKPIVVGHGGAMIKRIGIAAREDLERFFDTRVFLDLHVRVKSEWREDDAVLGEI